MRTFIFICSLAYAVGQGYNYHGPAVNPSYLAPSSANGGQGEPGPKGYAYQSPAVHNNYQSPGAAPGGASFGSGAQSGGAFGSAPNGGNQGGLHLGGILGGSLQSAGPQSGVSASVQPGQVGLKGGNHGGYVGPNIRTEYIKEFFTYHVDDHEYINVNQGSPNSGTVKKNIRVVIIKGPEVSGLEDAAVSLSKNVNEQKLAIYVLSKQADIAELTKKLSSTDIQINPKPEVHFVKYKTEADAEQAKQAIHKQYESLDGPSSSQDGGTVPVHSFASKSAQQAPAPGPAPAPAPAAPAAPAAGYLPSSVL